MTLWLCSTRSILAFSGCKRALRVAHGAQPRAQLSFLLYLQTHVKDPHWILTVVGAWPSIRHCMLRRRLLKNNGDFHYTQYIYFYILNYSSCLIIYISDGTRWVYWDIFVRPGLEKNRQTRCVSVEQLNAHNQTQDMEVAVLFGLPDLTSQSYKFHEETMVVSEQLMNNISQQITYLIVLAWHIKRWRWWDKTKCGS